MRSALFYEDLSPYRYNSIPTGLPGVLNVGWLGSSAAQVGDIDEDVAQRIAHFCEAPIMLTRGHHSCGLCNGFNGNGEVWIPGDDGRVYASPAMIAHYVKAHRYLPPPAFLEAVTGGLAPVEGFQASLTHLADVHVHHRLRDEAHLLLRLQSPTLCLGQNPAKFCGRCCARHVSGRNGARFSRAHAGLVRGCSSRIRRELAGKYHRYSTYVHCLFDQFKKRKLSLRRNVSRAKGFKDQAIAQCCLNHCPDQFRFETGNEFDLQNAGFEVRLERS